MTILPLDPAANRSPEALRGFLAGCQAASVAKGRALLVSITLEVDALDPLAVLESIFEPGERHFYVERPGERTALAGAEAVLSFSAQGPERFEACRRFIDKTLEHAIAVGDLMRPFSGPHFFCAFTFLDNTEDGEPFEAASVFVPRWQVALKDGRTVAVANLLIDSMSPVDALTERIWRAHAKFGSFSYAAPDFGAGRVRPTHIAEAGPENGYQVAVARALKEIESGRLEKIVLARAKDLTASETLHPLRVLNGLRQRFSDCYAFSVANGRGQSFIGASPERLVKVESGQLQTEALAGSARRGATASEDAALAAGLQRDEKEAREHRHVLDAIVQRLSALHLEPEYPAKPGLRRFANVQHLHSAVKACVPQNVHVLDLVGKLHPTPAVGGVPPEAAVQAIRGFEAFPRGLYAGALGWVDCRNDGEFLVGLRSALVDAKTARIYAGAGIVKGSDPEREFAETELKFHAMQEALLSGT